MAHTTLLPGKITPEQLEITFASPLWPCESHAQQQKWSMKRSQQVWNTTRITVTPPHTVSSLLSEERWRSVSDFMLTCRMFIWFLLDQKFANISHTQHIYRNWVERTGVYCTSRHSPNKRQKMWHYHVHCMAKLQCDRWKLLQLRHSSHTYNCNATLLQKQLETPSSIRKVQKRLRAQFAAEKKKIT